MTTPQRARRPAKSATIARSSPGPCFCGLPAGSRGFLVCAAACEAPRANMSLRRARAVRCCIAQRVLPASAFSKTQLKKRGSAAKCVSCVAGARDQQPAAPAPRPGGDGEDRSTVARAALPAIEHLASFADGVAACVGGKKRRKAEVGANTN
jgi:hypothetical protein